MKSIKILADIVYQKLSIIKEVCICCYTYKFSETEIIFRRIKTWRKNHARNLGILRDLTDEDETYFVIEDKKQENYAKNFFKL